MVKFSKSFAALLGAVFGLPVLAATYTVTDLGTGTPVGINNANQVVGTIGNQAYVWSNGTNTPLPIPAGVTSVSATGINSQGQVSATLSGSSSFKAGMWDGNLWTNLTAASYSSNGGTNHPGYAAGISNSGIVVGAEGTMGFSGAAYSYANGTAQSIGSNGFESAAIDPGGTTVAGFVGTYARAVPHGFPLQSFTNQAAYVQNGVTTTLEPGIYTSGQDRKPAA